MDQKNGETQRIEHVVDDTQPDTAANHLMRSKEDDLSVWKSLFRHKLVATIAMAAAFSASLDGYRGFSRCFNGICIC
jgi:hypothetical protein